MHGTSYRPSDLSLIKGFSKKFSFEDFHNFFEENCPGQWSMIYATRTRFFAHFDKSHLQFAHHCFLRNLLTSCMLQIAESIFSDTNVTLILIPRKMEYQHDRNVNIRTQSKAMYHIDSFAQIKDLHIGNMEVLLSHTHSIVLVFSIF